MEEQMHMIADATHDHRNHVMVQANAGHIGQKLWLHLFGNDLAAFFGAEHQMKMTLRIGMRHVSFLRGRNSTSDSFCSGPYPPGFRAGASTFKCPGAIDNPAPMTIDNPAPEARHNVAQPETAGSKST